MTADEIRAWNQKGCTATQCQVEIAAQLAELNHNLERLRLNIMIGSSPIMSHQLLDSIGAPPGNTLADRVQAMMMERYRKAGEHGG